jgi:hypothetical protein
MKGIVSLLAAALVLVLVVTLVDIEFFDTNNNKPSLVIEDFDIPLAETDTEKNNTQNSRIRYNNHLIYRNIPTKVVIALLAAALVLVILTTYADFNTKNNIR